jgi:hypothetical protein
MSVEKPTLEPGLADLLSSVVERRGGFVCIGSWTEEAVYLNAHGRRMVEADSGLDIRRTSLLEFIAPDDQAYFREVIAAEVDRRGRWSGDFRLRNLRTGLPIAVALEIFRLAVGLEEGACVAMVAHDISERVRSESRTRLLVDAGAALSNSLEYEQTFQELARLVVHGFASYCIIDIFSESGGRKGIRRVAAAHVDPIRRPLVERLVEFVPDLEFRNQPIATALLEGTSTLMHEVDDEWIEGITLDSDHAAVLRELGLRSWMTVALVARGKILGSLTCGIGEESRYRAGFAHGYDAEDLFFVEELGRRAGTAIENARLYEYQRNIAVTLQAASLPSSLPHIDHLRLSAEYRPGSDEATIGGDWYDAFQLEDGRVVLTVGDVLGHGLHAAVTMTKLRQAMQSAAMVNADPVVMLEVADRTLGLHDPHGFATAMAAVFDPLDHGLHFASAGHPPAVIRYEDGIVDELQITGTLLGVRMGSPRKSSFITLPPQCMLVFVTDGLTEATRDISEGNQRLRDAISALDVTGASVARWVVDTVLAGAKGTDDIAVLCARIAPDQAREEAPRQATYENFDSD